MLQIIGLIAGVISLAGGIFFVFVRRRECESAAASKAWPSAPGRIVSATVRKIGGIRPGYVPVVEYTFEAKGQEIAGKRISYRVLASRDEAEMTRIAAKYPAGARVKVFYDPENTGDNVLEPGPEGTRIFTPDVVWLIAAGVFGILACLFLT